MSRIGLGLLWLLHLLPYGVIGRIGTAMGVVLWPLARKRRAITLRNLELCFPDWTQARREQVGRAHFICVSRAFLERVVLWWASPARLERVLHLRGAVDEALHGAGAVLLLGIHFEGMDAAWTALTLAAQRPLSGMYTPQKSKVLDRWVLDGRSRFHTERIVSRHEGAGGMLRALRRGTPFYTLPDMDFGERHSRFIPFFGVPAATLDAVPRLAASSKARVYPVVARMLPGYAGYEITIHPAWDHFPTLQDGRLADIDADLLRMNHFIEQRVLEMPEQYHWVHKRFKTRPPGEPSLY
ncbi:Lipid A biosynthesis acyltransferase [Thiomonas sp. X19]|uniref:LpxL/LpxP family acyltransferase n=1 Tax=Thiomonas sp. X19 TaxID=1050370 RepID=UPI000B646999|nr:lipid A biosynthesis acyltransferase [Thiomonas sp. X19]SCC95534.1 Lipid A biosynthesis acyltransferase [Thiomonas sp. X19]